jgi:signal transduction histidine kinase
MSLRRTVFGGIALAIVAIVLLEAVFDVAVDAVTTHQRAALERRVDAALAIFVARPPSAGRSGTSARAFDARGRETLARPATSTTAAPTGAWPPDERPDLWFSATRVAPEGAPLEVAVAIDWTERLLTNKLLLDLLDLPLFLLIAFGVAAAVSRRVDRPIAALNAAVEEIAARRHPRPLPVPSGDDELARLGRSFNAMNDAVQRYLERERTFTRYASHELRTPLAALKVQVERARVGNADVATILPALERNVTRMELVLDALQSLARASDRDTVPTRLRLVINDLLDALPRDARGRIAIDAAPPDRAISDAQLVRQALLNLLENALAYATGAITLSVHVQGTSLTIRVRDVGPGVDAADLTRLTEPFYRPKGTGGRGLGLGLSLVDVIARALDGELDLRNTGTGFEATVRLPVVVPD